MLGSEGGQGELGLPLFLPFPDMGALVLVLPSEVGMSYWDHVLDLRDMGIQGILVWLSYLLPTRSGGTSVPNHVPVWEIGHLGNAWVWGMIG